MLPSGNGLEIEKSRFRRRIPGKIADKQFILLLMFCQVRHGAYAGLAEWIIQESWKNKETPMAATLTGLGKGLDALIRETSETRDLSGVQVLPLKDIIPNPNQPRRKFNDKSLEELASSIRSQGILQPLLVRPCGPAKPGKYEIVAGERRWRASQLAGLTEIPVLVRSFSAQDTLAAALIENLQREDLNPLEEALGIQTLKDEFGLSQDDLAKKLGKSRSAIANCLRLLSLPEATRKDLAEGRLSAGHARALLGITDPQAQDRLKSLIMDRQLSVREAEGLAAAWKETGTLDFSALMRTPADGEEKSPENEGKGDFSTGDARRSTRPESAEAKRPRPQSARLLEVQARISSVLNTSVRVTGKEDKGKISLSYNSKEELEELLSRLASPALEGRTQPVLAGSDKPVLEGRNRPSLDGAALDALDAAKRLSLAGADSSDALNAGSPSDAHGIEKTGFFK